MLSMFKPIETTSLNKHPGALESFNTYRVVLDSLYDGVYVVDRDRRIRYWNRSAERLTGYAAEDVVGRRCMDNLLCHVDEEGCQLCFAKCPLKASMDDGELREAKVYLRHRDGHRQAVMVRTAPIRDEVGEVLGGVEIFNASHQVLAAMSELSDLQRSATQDYLTGLGNRRWLEDALRSKFGEMDRFGHPFSVLFADIDHFKKFNDLWGHEAGDLALKTVARTLQNNGRSVDDVVRWGGEEFLILLGHTGVDGIEVPAERFRALVESSRVRCQGQSLALTISIGGAVARAGETPDALLARADAALYRSKRRRNQVTIDRD